MKHPHHLRPGAADGLRRPASVIIIVSIKRITAHLDVLAGFVELNIQTVHGKVPAITQNPPSSGSANYRCE